MGTSPRGHDLSSELQVSVVVTLSALFVFGAFKGLIRAPLRSGLQTLVIGGLAAAATFGITNLIS